MAFMQEKGRVSRIQITKSLPTKKRAIREVTMAMTKNATVARTSLRFLGASGATAEESRPVGKMPVSRRSVGAGQSQPHGPSLLAYPMRMRTPATLTMEKENESL